MSSEAGAGVAILFTFLFIFLFVFIIIGAVYVITSIIYKKILEKSLDKYEPLIKDNQNKINELLNESNEILIKSVE